MAEDPIRLLDEGGSELLQSLLSAAREEQPSHAAVQRTLTAVGVGAAVATVATTASAAATGATQGLAGVASFGSAKGVMSTTLFVVLKWVGAGALAGIVATSAVYAVSEPHVPSPHAAEANGPVVASAPPKAPPAQGNALPTHEGVEPPPPVPATSAALAPSAAPGTSARVALPPVSVPAEVDPDTQLAAELGVLDNARQAVAAGNAPRALQSLNDYDARFTRPNLLPEALYLRLEALTLQGDKSGTEAIARRILRSYPSGPHAARARAVLGLEP